MVRQSHEKVEYMNSDLNLLFQNLSSSRNMSRYNIVSKLFGIKNTLPVSIHNPAIKGAVNNTTKQKD